MFQRAMTWLSDLDEELDKGRHAWLILVALVLAVVVALGTTAATVFADEASAKVAVLDAEIVATQSSRPALPDDFKPNRPTDPDDVGSVAQSFAASQSLVSTLHELLGSEGSLTWSPSRPVTIRRPEATVTIKPGTVVTYSIDDSRAVLTFSPPRPSVEARVLGLRVTPELTRLELTPDNAGLAHTQSSGVNLPIKRFQIRWDEAASLSSACLCGCGRLDCDCSKCHKAPPVESRVTTKSQPTNGPDTPPPNKLPPVTLYSASWCPACPAQLAAVSRLPPHQRDRVTVLTADYATTHRENGWTWEITQRPAFVWFDGNKLQMRTTVDELLRDWRQP